MKHLVSGLFSVILRSFSPENATSTPAVLPSDAFPHFRANPPTIHLHSPPFPPLIPLDSPAISTSQPLHSAHAISRPSTRLTPNVAGAPSPLSCLPSVVPRTNNPNIPSPRPPSCNINLALKGSSGCTPSPPPR